MSSICFIEWRARWSLCLIGSVEEASSFVVKGRVVCGLEVGRGVVPVTGGRGGLVWDEEEREERRVRRRGRRGGRVSRSEGEREGGRGRGPLIGGGWGGIVVVGSGWRGGEVEMLFRGRELSGS